MAQMCATETRKLGSGNVRLRCHNEVAPGSMYCAGCRAAGLERVRSLQVSKATGLRWTTGRRA